MSLPVLSCQILLHFRLARVCPELWQEWMLEVHWIACCHKSRCQLAAQLTADLWCVSARVSIVSSVEAGSSPPWKRKPCWLQVKYLCNPLNTKLRPLYLNTQSVPRCKHFSSLYKNQSVYSYCSSMYSYFCICILIVVYVFSLLSMYS